MSSEMKFILNRKVLDTDSNMPTYNAKVYMKVFKVLE